MKPTPANNYLKPDEEIQQFKELYPTSKNSDLADRFNLSRHQINRWGSKLRLKKEKVKRGPVCTATKICTRCKEEKNLAKSFNKDKHSPDGRQYICIVCSNENSRSRWHRVNFNPIISKVKRKSKQDPPEWWIKENKKILILQ